jgi:hypothetical protein
VQYELRRVRAALLESHLCDELHELGEPRTQSLKKTVKGALEQADNIWSLRIDKLGRLLAIHLLG